MLEVAFNPLITKAGFSSSNELAINKLCVKIKPSIVDFWFMVAGLMDTSYSSMSSTSNQDGYNVTMIQNP